MERQAGAALRSPATAATAAAATGTGGLQALRSSGSAATQVLERRASSARSSSGDTPLSPFSAAAWLPPFPQQGATAAASLAQASASHAGSSGGLATRAASAAPAGRTVSVQPASRRSDDELWPRLAQMALASGGGAPPQPPPQPAAERQLPPVGVPPGGAAPVPPSAAPTVPATPASSHHDLGCSGAGSSSDACSNGWEPAPADTAAPGAAGPAAPALQDARAAHDLVRQDTLPAQLQPWWVDPGEVRFLRDPATGRLRELGRGAR